jgi:hypothetical protein
VRLHHGLAVWDGLIVGPANGQKRPLATLALELRTVAGRREVTPPEALVSDTKEWQKELQELRDQWEADARAKLDSGSVSIGDLRFDDLGAGGLTAVVSIITSARDRIPLDRFGQGIAELPGKWSGSLETFLREVTGEQELQVTVHRTYVETEPPASSPLPKPTLTKKEQRSIRIFSAAMFLLIALFVLTVLGAPPLCIWLAWAS